MKTKRWLLSVALLSLIMSFFIFTINYIVDPYNITKYNLLDIKYKFARDDRTEKLNYFKTLDRFDNILIGSSRVYSINPEVVTKLIGGSTYNFGVGTATIEDILGIVKYLEKNHKLPKNLIIGIDFYTFNPDLPPNKYFLKNKELNFLSYANYQENYISKFFSLDAFRASIKTLRNHFSTKNAIPRFKKNGWGGIYQDYAKKSIDLNFIYEKKELNKNKTLFYSDFKYSSIDKKRIAYLEEVKKIVAENHINLFIFNTPLHPIVLNIMKTDKNLKLALKEFLLYLNTFENFVNLYDDKDIYNNLKNFDGATHTSANAGDMILYKVLKGYSHINHTKPFLKYK
jgi:hypothetical protein